MWLNTDLIREEGKVYQGCSTSLDDHPNSRSQLQRVLWGCTELDTTEAT